MRIALAQINPIVGDLSGNTQKIIDYATRARESRADLVVFPELCVTGYPPLDLLESEAFIDEVELCCAEIARSVPSDIGVLIGAPIRNDGSVGKRLFNAALIYEGGNLVAEVRKQLLPTYDVFDEYRYFEPGDCSKPVDFRGVKLGLHVCEDMWNNEEQAEFHLYGQNPIDALADDGADVFINISSSPFSVGKHELRNKVVGESCREHGIPFVLVNTVGANTEIIFDGDSRVHAADGTRVLCAPSFVESLLVWDMDSPVEECPMKHTDIGDLHDALVLGIRDYFEKTGAFSKTLIGLSGGIDSAVTCALAVAALGADKVVGVTLPSHYSSTGSVTDSEALAKNFGIEFSDISIEPAVDAFGEMLESSFRGTKSGVAEENIQARTRGVTLMALSNKFNYLLLTTGNKSEMSVGYATLYGDMNGGVAVLSDVYKTDVYKLAEYINKHAGQDVIPRNTIDKPPSAELRPDQKDTDSLPEYDVLDRILRLYIEQQREWKSIVKETGYAQEMVVRFLNLVDRNEYKRRQAPPGLRVSEKAFGMGRRVPIVMRWRRETGKE